MSIEFIIDNREYKESLFDLIKKTAKEQFEGKYM